MDLFSKLQRPLATCFLIPLAERLKGGVEEENGESGAYTLRCVVISLLLRQIIRGTVSAPTDGCLSISGPTATHLHTDNRHDAKSHREVHKNKRLRRQ